MPRALSTVSCASGQQLSTNVWISALVVPAEKLTIKLQSCPSCGAPLGHANNRAGALMAEVLEASWRTDTPQEARGTGAEAFATEKK
eukprot:CAMPEP_0175339124 /NCGR_PEP_ID=MMETSP0095-20121207/5178_1 /TAXON_ID=311494 /ORGANISM="Alexandrium monilatum, Strain CCMP3105" /LENGTH=86 /DNA_ID=CAMNT_0016636527 /DNA_START=69 /DNA_END=326 /DNA_ORIENTATION=-